jgi:hypothetical protein
MAPPQAKVGFIEAIQRRFPGDTITVVHGAKGGSAISLWDVVPRQDSRWSPEG